MRIENDIIYKGHAVMALEIYPDFSFMETKKVPEQYAEQLQKEYSMLAKLVELKSFRVLMGIPESEERTPNDFIKNVEIFKQDLQDYKLPASLLDSVFAYARADYSHTINAVRMKANTDFPILSVLYLQENKNYILSDAGTITHSYDLLNKKYKNKQEELKDCKDADFVEQQLEPVKKEMAKFQRQHKDTLKSLKQEQATFDAYIDKVGLRSVYEDFLNAPAPQAKIVKTKKAKP